jgi:hypothetical protein
MAAGCIVCAMVIAGPAIAQQPLPGSEGEPPAAQQPDPNYRPGFLDVLNRWLGNSKDAVDSQFRKSQETLGSIGNEATGAAQGAAGVARDVAGTVVALPLARIVNGRQVCPVAANGAPDCQPAIDTLCRTKGFQTGKSLEISSGQKCPVLVRLYGTPEQKAECRVETSVTRALCQ